MFIIQILPTFNKQWQLSAFCNDVLEWSTGKLFFFWLKYKQELSFYVIELLPHPIFSKLLNTWNRFDGEGKVKCNIIIIIIIITLTDIMTSLQLSSINGPCPHLGSRLAGACLSLSASHRPHIDKLMFMPMAIYSLNLASVLFLSAILVFGLKMLISLCHISFISTFEF